MDSGFFTEKSGDLLLVKDPAEFHHLVVVKRLGIGDKVRLINGFGESYLAVIQEIDKKSKILKARLLEVDLKERESPYKITLAFSPLGEKRANDILVEKCVELGVSKFIPVLFERTVKNRFSVERWYRIARETVKQCGRTVVPEVSDLVDLNTLLNIGDQFNHKLFGYIEGSPMESGGNFSGDVLLVVGPEGDFTSFEKGTLLKNGFKGVNLGTTILKAETAAIVLTFLVAYKMGAPVKPTKRR